MIRLCTLRSLTQNYFLLIYLFILFTPSTVIHAQTSGTGIPSNANQEYLRQQERERVLRQQQETSIDVRLPQATTENDTQRIPSQETPCFRISSIVLNGEASEKFGWALKSVDQMNDQTSDPALPRCLGAQGINIVMKRIQNAIIQRGYITTRVLATAQDLNNGTLTLTVIPGRIHSIRFAEGTDPRATQWNAIPIAAGDLLNLRDIEQALENFKRVPTADADIQIAPASDQQAPPGASDLVIQWKQKLPFRLTLSADDAGTKATGRYQGNLTLSYDHAFVLNDLFYLSLNHDLGGGDPGNRGTQGRTLHYSIPYGYWLLSYNNSQNEYHQTVIGLNQNYLYRGKSQTSDLKLARLVYRDAVRKTTLSLRGWMRSSNNYIDDTEVEIQRRRMAGWEAGANHREYLGSNTLDLNLGYRRGTGAMQSLPAPEESFGEGTARPTIITTDNQLTIPFTVGQQRFRYLNNWRAQWNRTPLVPQDRFALGSRYTIRGFDGESILSAERGWLIRNDIGWALGNSGQELYLGLDHGEVGGASSQNLIGRRLTGSAIGLRGSLNAGVSALSYDIFVGTPVKKPDGFKTSGSMAGFNLNWTF